MRVFGPALRHLSLAGLLMSCSSLAMAQKDVSLHYRFILEGAPSASSGTVWLFHYSWYGLEKFELARILDGDAWIALDERKLAREVRPNPKVESYLLLVDFGGSWHRSRNIKPAKLFDDFSAALDALGQTRRDSRGRTTLTLPAYAERQVTLRYPDGRPLASRQIPVAIYIYDYNHCAAHFGIDLGTYLTDKRGVLHLRAGKYPLYLDIPYWTSERRRYCLNPGLKLPKPASSLSIQRTWDVPAEGFEVTVSSSGAKPLPGADIEESDCSNACGRLVRSVGKTGPDGRAAVLLHPAAIESLDMTLPSGQRRTLSPQELAELILTGRLRISW